MCIRDSTLGAVSNLKTTARLAEKLLQQFKDPDSRLFTFYPTKNGTEKYISTSSFRITRTGSSGYVYMLTGNTERSSAIILLCPGTATAVVALGNSGYSLHILAMNVLRMLNHNWKLKKFQ